MELEFKNFKAGSAIKLGAQVFLTDPLDRLRLLEKNVETNLKQGDLQGSVNSTRAYMG